MKQVRLVAFLLFCGLLFLLLLTASAVVARPRFDCVSGMPANVCFYQNGRMICGCGDTGGGGDTTPGGDGGNLTPGGGSTATTLGDDGIGGTPGSGVVPTPSAFTPAPTATPGGPVEQVCWDCMPWAYCPSGYASPFCVVTNHGDFTWVQQWSCTVPGVCDSLMNDPPDDTIEPPCTPSFEDGGGNCENQDQWGYQIDVWARVPPHRVQVDPFPRWIVGMGAPLPAPFESGSPGMLTLQDYPAYSPFPGLCGPNGPGYSEGCWSDPAAFPRRLSSEEPQPGDIREWRMGLLWRRLDQTAGEDLGPYPIICWDLDERDWNIGQDFGYGPIPAMACGNPVTHIYETSSWDKPHNGPRFLLPEEVCSSWQDHCCEQVPSGDGEWDIPAYQVRVPTYWSVQWATRWEAWEVVAVEEGECSCSGIDPRASPFWSSCGDPPLGLCVGNDVTEWWGRWGEPVYDWVEHFDGWHTFDLREYGGSAWYYTQWGVVTTGAGQWCAFEYADPNPEDTVRVVVIEVQVPLSDPCLVDDNCP